MNAQEARQKLERKIFSEDEVKEFFNEVNLSIAAGKDEFQIKSELSPGQQRYLVGLGYKIFWDKYLSTWMCSF